MDKTNPRLNFLESALTRNLSWCASADSKVPSTFAIDVSMLGVLFGLAPKVTQWATSTAIVFTIAGLMLLGSVIFLSLVTFPRLGGPKGSILYFGGIVQHSEEVFRKKLLEDSLDSIYDDLIRQIYRNAEIANQKYTNARFAMICLFCSVPFWLASVWLLYAAR